MLLNALQTYIAKHDALSHFVLIILSRREEECQDEEKRKIIEQ